MSDLNHFETQSLYRKEAPRTLLTFRSENMANISPLIDSMIKEYLLFRGFTSTFKAFEGEIKADKDKSFRVSFDFVLCCCMAERQENLLVMLSLSFCSNIRNSN